jgi:hypothetical protein
MQRQSLSSVEIKSSNQDTVAQSVSNYIDWLRKEHPEVVRIIWFGSRVNGLPTPGSDVDLCIVVMSSNKSRRDRIPDYLPVGFPVGIDLFVYTIEEFKQLRKTSPSWFATITAGREL